MNEDLRVKIAGEINSSDNMTGYLSGALDDYLEDLMSRKQKLKEQFAKSREHLEWQASGEDEELNEKISTIQECAKTIKEKVRSIYVRNSG